MYVLYGAPYFCFEKIVFLYNDIHIYLKRRYIHGPNRHMPREWVYRTFI